MEEKEDAKLSPQSAQKNVKDKEAFTMTFYKVTTKDATLLFQGNNKEEAFRDFILKTPLEKMGNLVMLIDEEGEEYPFRTLPSLVLLGRIDFPTGAYNLQKLLDLSFEEAKTMLICSMKKDAWILSEEFLQS